MGKSVGSDCFVSKKRVIKAHLIQRMDPFPLISKKKKKKKRSWGRGTACPSAPHLGFPGFPLDLEPGAHGGRAMEAGLAGAGVGGAGVEHMF